MYMRYYPKQLKPIHRLDQNLGDRGKRHYWGYQKGDYGFYKSQDQQYIKNLRSTRRHDRHQRSHTVDSLAMNNNEYHHQNNNEQETYYNQTPIKKNVVKFINPQQIRLPSISRVSRQTQTDSFSKVKQTIKKQMDPYQQKQRQIEKIHTQRDRMNTEPAQTNIRNAPHVIQFSPRTRFSPTFVCSMQNPLPSYIIQPHLYNSYNYMRAESVNSKPSYRKL